MAPRTVATPLKPLQQPVRLRRTGHGAIPVVPVVSIHCTAKPAVDGDHRARESGWPVLELAAGHFPAASAPRDLVDLFLRSIEVAA